MLQNTHGTIEIINHIVVLRLIVADNRMKLLNRLKNTIGKYFTVFNCWSTCVKSSPVRVIIRAIWKEIVVFHRPGYIRLIESKEVARGSRIYLSSLKRISS